MLKRQPFTARVNFTSSTVGVSEPGPSRRAGDPIDISEYAFGGMHVTSGLSGRTVSFVDNGPWGAEVVLTKVLSTGFNWFDSDEVLRIGSALNLTATLDAPATGSFWLKLKS